MKKQSRKLQNPISNWTSTSLIMALLATLFHWHAQAQVACQRALLHLSGTDILEQIKNTKELGNRLYPEGVNPRTNPDSHLMFGFESEYTLAESEKLLSAYGPLEHRMKKRVWSSLTFNQKKDWVKNAIANMPTGSKEPLLELQLAPEGLDFLPKQLVIDETQNLEIVLQPMNTYQEFVDRVTKVNQVFGKGSMQAMVTATREQFFPTNQERPKSIQENLGFFTYINDMDVLSRMATGALKFSRNPQKESLRTFAHPFLGPLTLARQNMLKEYMEQNANGEYVDSGSLGRVSFQYQSFKYLGSSAYRPDIGGSTRFGIETRDAHKDEALLFERTIRNTFYLETGRTQFQLFSKLRAFDSEADFKKLPEDVQKMLHELFPPNIKNHIATYSPAVLAFSTYRNFAFPLRDWSYHLQAINRLDLRDEVQVAQANFLNRLNEISREISRGSLNPELARARVQGVTSLFAVESQLFEAMDKWHAENVSKDSDWNNYWRQELRGSAALGFAYQRNNWSGPIEQRLEYFYRKNADVAEIIDGIEIAMDPGTVGWKNTKRVLVISTKEAFANDARGNSLVSDYLNMLARGTISFPVKSGGEHLYSRVGNLVFDLNFGLSTVNPRITAPGDLRVNRFYLSSSPRLEPVVVLNPTEELNLRTYVQNAKDNLDETVGGFNYYGSQKTNGKLKDNRCLGADGHSCTSWISTAPIGADGQSIMKLSGVMPGYEVGTNPGWWNGYLTTRSPESRVPFVIFWTGLESKSDAVQRLKRERKLDWQFNPK